MSTQHNLRQRKKLHLGEFQEFGFEFSAQLNAGLSKAQEEVLVDAFMDQFVEPGNMAFAGWANGGYLCRFRRGTLSESDRLAVKAWWSARTEVLSVEVGELIDAWN